MAHQVHRFDDLTDGSWPAKFRMLTLTSAPALSSALAMQNTGGPGGPLCFF